MGKSLDSKMGPSEYGTGTITSPPELCIDQVAQPQKCYSHKRCRRINSKPLAILQNFLISTFWPEFLNNIFRGSVPYVYAPTFKTSFYNLTGESRLNLCSNELAYDYLLFFPPHGS